MSVPTFRERLVPGVGTLLAVCLLAPATLLVFLPISLPIGIVAAIVVTAAAIAGLILSAPVVTVETAGSGDFVFGGEAGSLSARSAGSGDIRVARVTGPVSRATAGSGEITVGGR